MKVLFDSNVYVSDALFGGVAARAITLTLDARWRIFVCDTILDEVHRVILTKFNRGKAFTNSTVQVIRDVADVVAEPASRHVVPGDASDTPILRAAVGAGVDYLITGDAKLLAMIQVEGVRIINLSEYLYVLQNHGFT